VSKGVVRAAAVLVALAVGGGLAMAGCGSDDSPTVEAERDAGGDGGDAGTTTTSPGAADETTSTAGPAPTAEQRVDLHLTGDAVVPGPGGDGAADARLTYDGDELCLSGTTSGMGPVSGGHVHAGAAGEPGPVVVDLGIETADDGSFSGCAVVGAEGGVVLVDPSAYFVQLHTAEHPDGAVRAQIG
jgi:hypothetical protein